MWWQLANMFLEAILLQTVPSGKRLGNYGTLCSFLRDPAAAEGARGGFIPGGLGPMRGRGRLTWGGGPSEGAGGRLTWGAGVRRPGLGRAPTSWPCGLSGLLLLLWDLQPGYSDSGFMQSKRRRGHCSQLIEHFRGTLAQVVRGKS